MKNFFPLRIKKENKTIKVFMSKKCNNAKEMIYERVSVYTAPYKTGILCKCIKAKLKLNERIINFNFALIKSAI